MTKQQQRILLADNNHANIYTDNIVGLMNTGNKQVKQYNMVKLQHVLPRGLRT